MGADISSRSWEVGLLNPRRNPGSQSAATEGCGVLEITLAGTGRRSRSCKRVKELSDWCIQTYLRQRVPVSSPVDRHMVLPISGNTDISAIKILNKSPGPQK